MAKQSPEETIEAPESGGVEAHPFAFHVSGPRNVSPPNWKELINSSWKDGNYKRTVMACFIQGVYLIELDRQDNRTDENALAPKWWLPFKYKLVQTLTDERDGSTFGAIFEWDRPAALSDFILMRPTGAPRAVLALRGTLLKGPTIRRDIEDDLRFLTWESLKGSVRFNGALEALKSLSDKYGSGNVCVAGHSLGAGFALQIGKALAKDGIFVEAHLFNPPSVSIAMGLKNFGEKAGVAWKRIRSMLSSSNESEIQVNGEDNVGLNFNPTKWTPHLYVNNGDYICCYYTDKTEDDHKTVDKENAGPTSGSFPAKLFVLSKGNQRFMEAHGLEQWWADDLELQTAISNSKLMSRQLKCLYSLPVSSGVSPAGKLR